MKQLVLVSLIVTILGLCSSVAIADNITVLEAGTLDLNSGTNHTYSGIPAIDPGTEQCKLTFWMRSDTEGSGFAYGINIYVNGTMVNAADSRLKTRLVNKEPNFPYQQWNGIVYDTREYNRPATGWVVMLKSNYDNQSSPIWFQDPQWGYFELAVEDLVYDNQTNTVAFYNDHGSVDEVVDNITIGTYTGTTGFAGVEIEDAFPLSRSPRRTPSVGVPNASVDSATGAIVILLDNGTDNVTYRVDSLFSYPNGGYNLVGVGPSPESEEGAFDSSLSVTTVSSTNYKVTAAGAYYSLSRRVTMGTNGKIHIQDNITNTTGSDIGVITKHFVKFDNHTFQHVFMGGNPDAALNNAKKRMNPTLYIPTAEGGIGLVAEDDFFRLQVKCFYDVVDADGAGLKTEHLTIPASSTYTMEWSIYAYEDADGQGDYFDFVNLVRNDWGVNFKMNGPYAFAGPTDILAVSAATLQEVVAATDVYAYISTSHFTYDKQVISFFSDFYWGPDSSEFTAWKVDVDDAVAHLRTNVPDVKVLHKYSSVVNILDDASNFSDSLVTDQDNETAIYSGYRELTFPTLTNSYGSGLLDMFNYLLDNHSCDGIFWDELHAAGPSDGLLVPWSTFYIDGSPAWDNHSAAINLDDKSIVAKAYNLNILADAWIKARLTQLSDNNQLLIANSVPVTKDLTDLDWPYMTETHSNAQRTYETNLYSPLCYTGSGWIDIPMTRERLEYGGIPFRVPHNGTHAIIEFMGKLFPLTPIEIHRGWILGEERLITKYTGTYNWDTTQEGTLYTYLSTGYLDAEVRDNISSSGTTITVPTDGLAIFVIDPPGVTISESSGSTDVDEDGPTSDNYTVVLDLAPSDTVTITVDPDAQTDVGSGGGASITLTFTTGNWSSAQTVTVTAVDDNVTEDPIHTSTITHTAASNDSGYDGIGISSVIANVTDNDQASVLFSDGFESGGFGSGGWTTSANDADVSNKAEYTGTYGVLLVGTGWIQKAFSTAGYETISVKCNWKPDAKKNQVTVAEWDNGSGWATLESSGDGSWSAENWSCDSTADNNANFKIRFRGTVSKGEGYLDDVEITGFAQ